ncbi:hypothetical protein MMC10_004734 [Thelotrema lepadinum]|nr:hypothetical protein [Thelotrema lepadinum]
MPKLALKLVGLIGPVNTILPSFDSPLGQNVFILRPSQPSELCSYPPSFPHHIDAGNVTPTFLKSTLTTSERRRILKAILHIVEGRTGRFYAIEEEINKALVMSTIRKRVYNGIVREMKEKKWAEDEVTAVLGAWRREQEQVDRRVMEGWSLRLQIGTQKEGAEGKWMFGGDTIDITGRGWLY